MKTKSQAVLESEEQERLLTTNAIITLRNALRCEDTGDAAVKGHLCGPCATYRHTEDLEKGVLAATTLEEVCSVLHTYRANIPSLAFFATCENGFRPMKGQESCNCPVCTARRIVQPL